MNMHSAISTARIRGNVNQSADWRSAYAEYQRLLAIQNGISSEEDEEGFDAAVNATFDSMKRLVYHVPAPSADATLIKLDLLGEILDTKLDVIADDLRRIVTVSSVSKGETLIRQLHRRYEQLWEAFTRLDTLRAEPANSEDSHAYNRAMSELGDESQSVVRVILRQVPSCDEDLTIVLLHLASLYEDHVDLAEEDREAIEIGIKQSLDYLMGEGRADMEGLGRQATDQTMYVWQERRFRGGNVED